MTVSYTGGLNFTGPQKGETNWDTTVDAAYTQISAHDHSGSGNGTQITSTGLAANAVNGAAIRLNNNQGLRSRNAAGSADVEVFKLDTNNIVRWDTMFRFGANETLTANGAISATIPVTNLNGASLSMTLARTASADGCFKVIHNRASTTATITPDNTTGTNTFRLLSDGIALLILANNEWKVVYGYGCYISDPVTTAQTVAATISLTAPKITLSNAGAAALTINNDGFEGQECFMVNIGAGTWTVTFTGRPAASDVATILQNGSCMLKYANSMWHIIPGAGTTVA